MAVQSVAVEIAQESSKVPEVTEGQGNVMPSARSSSVLNGCDINEEYTRQELNL